MREVYKTYRNKLEQKIALLTFIQSLPGRSMTRIVSGCGIQNQIGKILLNDLEEAELIKEVASTTRYQNARYFEITLAGRIALAESQRLHEKLKVTVDI